MLIVLVALSGVVGKVAVPTLAAVLIYAATRSLRIHDARAVLRTSPTSMVVFVATFVATLFLPVSAAVGLGVVLSLLLQLNQESMDLRVVGLRPDAKGRFTETTVPTTLQDDDVVVLDVYGSLFYAGARTLRLRLPDPGAARRAVVILRLRGRTTLGATFVSVIGDYGNALEANDGALYLAGVDDDIADRWERDGLNSNLAGVELYRAKPQVFGSTYEAFLGAQSRRVQSPGRDDGRPHP